MTPGALRADDTLRVMDGNKAAAWGVLLCRPDLLASYPISPQTPLLEQLYKFRAEGRLDAETVEVEGENSALSAAVGAVATGGRAFTATSSMGLMFMYDAYLYASGQRVPVVMSVATREQCAPHTVSSGQQDIMMVKEGGWIQLIAESCQEILDSILVAYRLAEDPNIQVPVNVCYDGYYLSHLSEPVRVPAPAEADRFLAAVGVAKRPVLDTETPLTFGAFVLGEMYAEYRYKHCQAMQRALDLVETLDGEFLAAFGREFGGSVETYRTEDAEVLLVGTGSACGTLKVAIDRMRDAGLRAGLARVRMFRPFPRRRLAELMRGRRAIGVLDRSVCFGWNAGHLFVDVKATAADLDERVPVVNFIGGLAGSDLRREMLEDAVRTTVARGRGEAGPEVVWLGLE
jgi:pyruvate/2-oxoacid:ferredoxin oxidoreductase alpha subunit